MSLATKGWTVLDGQKPPASSASVRRCMQANGRRDTRNEVALRSALHRLGLRFRKDVLLRLPGTRVRPDVVFGSAKLAVFADGCWWHGCSECRHKTPRSEWWITKLRGNAERDRRVDEALRHAGWEVVRVWEHEDPHAAALRVAEVLHRRRRDR